MGDNRFKIGSEVLYGNRIGEVIAYVEDMDGAYYAVKFPRFGHGGGNDVSRWVDEYGNSLSHKHSMSESYWYFPVGNNAISLYAPAFEDKKIDDL